ncbi:MAG: hypothetical protein JWQ19_2112 [Subtercola sp.]|nr:hypothetical protein [Subtercola sp.]
MNRAPTLPIVAGVIVAVAALTIGVVAFGPLALVGLLGLVGLVVVIRRPWLGIAALVVYLPFNSVVATFLGAGTPSLVFGAVKDIIVIVLFIIVITSKKMLSRVSGSTVLIVVLIMLLALASSFQTPNNQQALYGFRNDYLHLLLLIIVPAVLTVQTAERVARVVAVVAQLATAFTLYSYSQGLQWLFTLGIFPVPSGTAYPSSLFVQGSIVPRAFSPFPGPNELALANLLFIVIIICRSNWKLVLRLALCVLPVVAIFLSQSRSGEIGLAVIVVVLLLRGMARAGAGTVLLGVVVVASLAGVGVVAFTTSFLTGDTVNLSAQGHALSLTESIPKLFENLFGFGVGQVGPRAYLYTTSPILVESYWLVLGLESGIVVLLLYFVLLAKLIVRPLRAKTLMAFTAVLAIAGSLVSQAVLPTLQDASTIYMLWIAVGIGIVAAEQALAPKEESLAGAEPITTIATTRSG